MLTHAAQVARAAAAAATRPELAGLRELDHDVLRSTLRARIGSDEESQQSAFAALKVLIIRCAGAALAYASQVLLARVLGQTDYGIFALVWVWILVLGHLSPLGFARQGGNYTRTSQSTNFRIYWPRD